MKIGRHRPQKLRASPENPCLGIKQATGPIDTGARSYQSNSVVYGAPVSLRMQRLNGFGVGCHNFEQSELVRSGVCDVVPSFGGTTGVKSPVSHEEARGQASQIA